MNDKKRLDVKIGSNIKCERERAGFTQEEFSEMIGIGSKSLSAAERGVVGISLLTLQRICTVLSIPSDRILFGNIAGAETDEITERLQRLSPQKYEIAKSMLRDLLAAFALSES